MMLNVGEVTVGRLLVMLRVTLIGIGVKVSGRRWCCSMLRRYIIFGSRNRLVSTRPE